jgi:holin-like protein
MLRAFIAILSFLLAGEALHRASGIPVPGPVIGIALLFGLCAVRGDIPADVDARGTLCCAICPCSSCQAASAL